MQTLRRKKLPLILKNPHLRPKKPKIMLKKLNILLRSKGHIIENQKDFEEPIAKFNHEAQQAKAILKKHKEAAKKQN